MKKLILLLLVVLGLQLTSCSCSSCDGPKVVESNIDSISTDSTEIDFNAPYGTYPRKSYSNGVSFIQETNRFKIYEHRAKHGVWVEDKELTAKLERIDSLLTVLSENLTIKSINSTNTYFNDY